MADRRILLGENDIPTRWYNIAPDLPSAPPPPLHPGTREPVGPDDLAPLFPMEIIRQEVSQDREVPIPDEVRALYSMWRPTPLVRALGLEQALGTRSRIFYKYEGVSPGGIAQAEHRGPAGLVRQGGGRPAARDRDGCGPVGLGALVRRRPAGPRDQGLHGADLVRLEAVPPVADRALGRPGRREPVRGDELGTGDPRGGPRIDRVARDRDLRGRRGRRDPRRHEVLARVGAQPRPHAPDRDRPGGAEADGARGRLPGCRDRMRGRRLELRGHRVPVPRRQDRRTRRSR